MSATCKRDVSWESGFYAGVLAALAVIKLHDESVIYGEVVDAVGEDSLVRAARRDGQMRISGLSSYLRSRP